MDGLADVGSGQGGGVAGDWEECGLVGDWEDRPFRVPSAFRAGRQVMRSGSGGEKGGE